MVILWVILAFVCGGLLVYSFCYHRLNSYRDELFELKNKQNDFDMDCEDVYDFIKNSDKVVHNMQEHANILHQQWNVFMEQYQEKNRQFFLLNSMDHEMEKQVYREPKDYCSSLSSTIK